MSRNFNSQFAYVPRIDVQRSAFDVPGGTCTTCNAGDLVPFMFTEVLPGSTFSYSTNANIRLTPSVHATMDCLFADFYYFFVPNRICYDDWKHFVGEPEDYWVPTQTYTVPQIQFPSGGWNAGSVADHFGLPTYVDSPLATDGSNEVNILPFLGFARIFNEFFRDENLQAPLYCPSDTTSLTGIVGWQAGSASEVASPLEGVMHGGSLPKVCKPHDYFTSALPYPIRSSADVTIPLASDGSRLPVVTGADHWSTSDLGIPMIFANSLGSAGVALGPGVVTNMHLYNPASSPALKGLQVTADPTDTSLVSGDDQFYPTNLWANVSSEVTATLNDLRYAFALQHLYEDMARCGARYREILKGIFGVSVDDPSKSVPEYLGGNRFTIQMNSVIQTSESGSTAQGNVSGYSHTFNKNRSFVKSFAEHGYVIGCFCIRQPKTYQQGVNRFWRRKDRFDFYWPEFAQIGSQKIRKDEIYFGNAATTNSEPFGYQEAWAEYRFSPRTVTGMFRSNYPGGTLDSWHYADYYASRPTLSDTWIADNSRANVDRTLSVTSVVADQFLVDISWSATHVVPMPVYSIPGLTKL